MGGGDKKPAKRKVLIVGGQFSGSFVAKELKSKFYCTVVDAKEYFEYTPGILRAYVKPSHFDALTFTLQPIIERKLGVKYIWGEVLKCEEKKEGDKFVGGTADIRPMFEQDKIDKVSWDYLMICAGCNFGPFHKWGESLWFPTIHKKARECPTAQWPHIDERFIEGRRRHILEEYHSLQNFNDLKSNFLITGAGFIGVEWCTEIEHFFHDINLTIVDMLPKCLGPLPASAAEYCAEYMDACGIKQFYGSQYGKKGAGDDKWWNSIDMPNRADKEYICIGVKASNYFMPPETLGTKGPGGGGWIHFNFHMQVCKNPTGKNDKGEPNGIPMPEDVWAGGRVFAMGDCNAGWIGDPPTWDNIGMPPIPKISYPGEEQAIHACWNVERLDKQLNGKGCCVPKQLKKTWWPWGAGMFATSLGPHDACFVFAANHNKGSGWMVNWWYPAALQKEIIETTKIDECRDGCIGLLIWHFVHHTPCNMFGKGPCVPWCH